MSGALVTIRTFGGLIPRDLISRLIEGRDLPGLSGDDYHLEIGVSTREAANRAWSILTGAWKGYRSALEGLDAADRATTLTREKWLLVLLRELGFGRIPMTPGGGLVADGRTFPISHLYEHVPVHLLGWGVPLDTRSPGVGGAAERAPHAMVQEFLNRSDHHLWALMSNGHTLRMLRDSSALAGPSYIEFDLEAMFDGEVFSDFAVLYLLCHESRFQVLHSELGPSDCWLECWRTIAIEGGTRALRDLRLGVQHAIELVGTGFVRHPANSALREGLESRTYSVAKYHHELLRLVYRLLFCFVTEDRELLLDPAASPQTKERFQRYFSTARLRRLATRRRGDSHGDLWLALKMVFRGLGQGDGIPQLGLGALGGLFGEEKSDLLNDCQLANEDLLAATRHLCVVAGAGGSPQRLVDYRNLGAEELGGIYESLLELVPRLDTAQRAFSLEVVSGNERKTSGSYYTPTSLIDCLLDSALNPLLDEAERAADPEAALLALSVCDPACGSGHFLVAAARRIAARLAFVREGGTEPTVLQTQTAMHEVVARSIYGVDLNPMAAELAKVSLWLEAVQPGQPLSFLDAHIKVGNALLGTTPALIAAGIPNEAFAPLEGDDRKTARILRNYNMEARKGQRTLFGLHGVSSDQRTLSDAARELDAMPAISLSAVQQAEHRYQEIAHSPEMRRARLVADGWCAAFVQVKRDGHPLITQATLERWQSQEHEDLDLVRDEVEQLSAQYHFFHWHLEFPQIFQVEEEKVDHRITGWRGGFSCVLGNPPWERIKLQEQEFFAMRDASIAGAANASVRKRLIAGLAETDPSLFQSFVDVRRQSEGESHFIRKSGRYPLCGRGDINTYAVFAEADRMLLSEGGRLGVIVPTGIATDATTQYFFKDLLTERSLVSLYDFENRKLLFEAVDSRTKFCLLTLSGLRVPVDTADFAFFLHDVADLAREDARFRLAPDEITLLNPNTGTCPVFRSRRDAEIVLGIYGRLPVLIREGDPDGNPWSLSFMRMFDMSNDSALFHSREELEAEGWRLQGNTFVRTTERMLPLYEAKMIHLYDHRWATYDADSDARDTTNEEHEDPHFTVLPRYWVEGGEVDARLEGHPRTGWLSGFRNIARTTDERTMIASRFPTAGVAHSLPLLRSAESRSYLLLASLSSLSADYVARTKLGGTNLTFFIIEQLAVPPPELFDEPCRWDQRHSVAEWIRPRFLELSYTAWDMQPAALGLGDGGAPFHWDEDRRASLRAELDAALFHLYGLGRQETDYILSTFRIVNRNDKQRFREERTRRLILENFDAMDRCMSSGEVFASSLAPAPGLGPRHTCYPAQLS